MKIVSAVREASRTTLVAGLVLVALIASVGCGKSDSGTPAAAPAAGEHKPNLGSDEK